MVGATDRRARTREASRHGVIAIATSFWRFVLLQISKIATILRRRSYRFHLRICACALRVLILLYRAGSITLQLVRPDSTQSCSLLAAVSSRASQIPTASSTTAINNHATAPRRLSPTLLPGLGPCLGSAMNDPQPPSHPQPKIGMRGQGWPGVLRGPGAIVTTLAADNRQTRGITPARSRSGWFANCAEPAWAQCGC